MKVKLQVSRETSGVRDARTMGLPERKGTACNRSGGIGLAMLIRIQMMPSKPSDERCGAAGFSPCFGQMFPWFIPIPFLLKW